MPEHEKYREVLLKHGISENALVCTGLSTNTLEEAKQAIPFHGEKGDLLKQNIPLEVMHSASVLKAYLQRISLYNED